MAVRAVSLAFLLLLAGCLAQHDHDHDHDHGSGGAFEWSGIFATPDSSYRWIAQAVDGSYKDPYMKIVVLPAAAATESELHALEAEAAHALEDGCSPLSVGGTIIPGERCYDLLFDASYTAQDVIRNATLNPNRQMMCYDLDSTFHIATDAVSNVAIFTEHVPTEFERSQHYLKDMIGEDIEPLAEKEWAPDPSKPWGTALGAAVLVNLVTLSGVVLLVPIVSSTIQQFPQVFTVVSNSFAAGTLLAAAFFLLLFEATHLIPIDESTTEAQASAMWGCMILLGFMTSFMIDAIAEMVSMAPATTHVKNCDQGQTNGPGKAGEVAVMVSDDEDCCDEASHSAMVRRRRVLSGVLIGDFMHNLCDGVFIATAFHLCEASTGWSVTAATVFHEIAQEVSDYVILTDPKQGGLKPLIALATNFISGTSVLLGAILVLALDNFSDKATGLILAFGGGVYLQIGASECMAKSYVESKSLTLRAVSLFAFFIGATAIGLVLLDHKHCEGAGHSHGHHGHGH